MCAIISNCASSLACWSCQGHVLVLMDEEGVILVMVNYVRNGRKCEVAYHILPLSIWVNVKVFTTAEEKKYIDHKPVQCSVI